MEQLLPSISEKSNTDESEEQTPVEQTPRPESEQQAAAKPKAVTPARQAIMTYDSAMALQMPTKRGKAFAGESQAVANLLQRARARVVPANALRFNATEQSRKIDAEILLQKRREQAAQAEAYRSKMEDSYNKNTSRKMGTGFRQSLSGMKGTQGMQGMQEMQRMQRMQGIQGMQGMQRMQGMQGIAGPQTRLPPIKRGQEREKDESLFSNELSLQATRVNADNKSRGSVEDNSIASVIDANLSSFSPAMRQRVEAALQMHVDGIPIEITFDRHSSYRLTKKSGACGIFHCPRCLSYWKLSGKPPDSCDETAVLTRGPLFEMKLTEVARMANTLKTNKRYVSEANLDKLLPILRRAATGSDRMKPVRTFLPKEVVIEHRVSLGPTSQMDSIIARTLNDEDKQRNHVTAVEFASASKLRLLSAVANSNLSWSTAVRSVGLRGNDASFYPGFFSHMPTSRDHDDLFNDTAISDLPFLARGRIDDDGCYHPYRADHPDELSETRFPSLLQMMMSQIDNSSYSGNASKFKFALQEGGEISLKEAFTSGMWYTKDGCEFYVTGVFNTRGVFIGTSCFTGDGYLLPGACDTRGRFVPFAYMESEGNFVAPSLPGRIPANVNSILERVRQMPACPKAQKLKGERGEYWRIVRDGVAVHDTQQITVYLTERPALQDCLGGTDALYLYIGGDVGPDKHLYPFGNYAEDGFFLAGGPPICFYYRPKNAANLVYDKPNWQAQIQKRAQRLKTTSATKMNEGFTMIKPKRVIDLSEKPRKLKKKDEKPRMLGETAVSIPETPPRRRSRKLNSLVPRDTSSHDRIYNRKTNGVSRTPSVVFVQETSMEELAKLSLPRTSSHDNVVNPAVRNRTGKPTPKTNSLTETNSDLSQVSIKESSEISLPYNSLARSSLPSEKSQSSLRSLTKVRKSIVEIPPQRPSSVVRERESVEFDLSRAPEMRKLSRVKPGEGTDHSEAEKKAGSRKNRVKATIKPEKKRKSIDKPRKSLGNRASEENFTKLPRKSKDFNEKPLGISGDPLVQKELQRQREDSLMLDSEEEDIHPERIEKIYDPNKSHYLPILDGKLNVTDTFRFSYFAVPGHLKEHHQKIERGELPLPSVAGKTEHELKEDIEERKRRRRDKSDLFRRIKMLEERDSD